MIMWFHIVFVQDVFNNIIMTANMIWILAVENLVQLRALLTTAQVSRVENLMF